MNVPEMVFKVIEDNQCPLYQLNDIFNLSGRSLKLPLAKPTCMVLMDDIKEAVKVCEKPDGTYELNCPLYRFNCSGPKTACSGVIRMEYKIGTDFTDVVYDKEKEERIRSIINILSRFQIFRGLDELQLKSLGNFLKFKEVNKGEVIINKGEPGINLYIIAIGKVEILGEDAIRITYLEKGEVFGEMSLISGEAVGATVRAVEPTRLLYIKGKDFTKILNQYPSMQMYFARLLAKRLAEANKARSRDFAYGMSGKLSDIPPAELFQALNVNQKTGAVDFILNKGNARVCFKGGEMVWASYKEAKGAEAFFLILKEKSGRFRFTSELSEEEERAETLGDFIWLLMEGVRKMDEENSAGND